MGKLPARFTSNAQLVDLLWNNLLWDELLQVNLLE